MFAQRHDSAWPQDFTWPRRPCWHNHFAAVLSVPGESTVLTCDSSHNEGSPATGSDFFPFFPTGWQDTSCWQDPRPGQEGGVRRGRAVALPLTASDALGQRCRCRMLAPLSLLPRTVRYPGKNRQKHEKSHGNFHYQGKGSATLSMAYAGARLGKARFPIMELPWLISQKSDNLGIREAQCSWCQHAQLSGVSFRQTCYQRSWVHFFFWAQDRWIDRIKLTRLAQLWHWRLSLLASMVKQSQSYSEANSIALIHACDLCPI